MSATEPSSATPILDSGIRPRSKPKSLGNMLIGFGLAIPFALVLIAVSNDTRRDRNAPFDYLFPTYLLCFVLTVAVHELGHLVGGWMVGFKFSSIAIGPLSLQLEYGALKIRARKAIAASGYAGMHIDRTRRLRRRLLRFILAGPMANLLTAAFAAALLSFAPPTSNWLAAFLDMLWMQSALIGFINLVPFRSGILYTDGARMLMLRSSLPKSRRWLTLFAIGNQVQNGVRPRLWKRTWADAAGLVRDGSVDDFAGNWLAYLAANDRKDTSTAARHLERCLELTNLLGPSLRDLVTLEAAVFSAWFREDAKAAQKWFGQVSKPKALPKLMQSRAEIALSCARTEFDSALSLWQTTYAFIEKLPPTAVKTRLKEGFLEWRDEIQERENLYNANSASVPLVETTQP